MIHAVQPVATDEIDLTMRTALATELALCTYGECTIDPVDAALGLTGVPLPCSDEEFRVLEICAENLMRSYGADVLNRIVEGSPSAPTNTPPDDAMFGFRVQDGQIVIRSLMEVAIPIDIVAPSDSGQVVSRLLLDNFMRDLRAGGIAELQKAFTRVSKGEPL